MQGEIMKTKHKILFGIAILMAVVSWVIAIYYWDKLPNSIPTHFGFNGQPGDWSAKSLFSVFFLPAIQTLMQVGFVFLYYKPQYSDMPTTMWLMTIDKKNREHAFELIRKMLVGTSLWIGALFTYITFGMNISAVNETSGLISWVMFALIGGMLVWLAFWTFRVYRATKEAIASSNKGSK